MKATFKPMGIAVAVAAASAAYAGTVSAQAAINAGHLGDLALVPYYTTQAGYVTGVHITNTSAATQVVKLRLRRGSDSMDALDFNLIMSPYDMWTGTVKADGDDIIFRTADTTCTAPEPNHEQGFLMPDPADGSTDIDFREGAEEGYIEVIGMGQPATETMAIAITSEHEETGAPGAEPLSCLSTSTNFFRNSMAAVGDGDPAEMGVISSSMTMQTIPDPADDAEPGDFINVPNVYVDSPNVLSVSYFIRDAESGLEMGSKAVHIQDFNTVPMMSHQQTYVSGSANEDVWSYFYPDLDGGSPVDGGRGVYATAVRPALGVESVINDWSVNADLNVQTDWVVTIPGQYLMVNFPQFVSSLQEDSDVLCTDEDELDSEGDLTDYACDFRDIPVVASYVEIRDREEQQTIITPEMPGLVVSPSVGTTPDIPVTELPYEVNVIKWFGPDTAGEDGVLSSQYAGSVDVGDLGVSGWAQLEIAADDKVNGQMVCGTTIESEIDVAPTCTDVTGTAVPMIGFVAWKRSFPDMPDGNYGRIIDHSWTASS
jgi:hypothetical protein